MSVLVFKRFFVTQFASSLLVKVIAFFFFLQTLSCTENPNAATFQDETGASSVATPEVLAQPEETQVTTSSGQVVTISESFKITQPLEYVNSNSTQAVWTRIAKIHYYDVFVSVENKCLIPLKHWFHINENQVQIEGLVDGVYYLCVQGILNVEKNSKDGLKWADNNPYKFTIDTLPPTPGSLAAFVTPSNSTTQTFSWDAGTGANYYDLIIGSDSACQTEVVKATDLTETTVSFSDLAAGTYYVCLKYRDFAGNQSDAINSGLPLQIDLTPPVSSLTVATKIGPNSFAGNTTVLSGISSDVDTSVVEVDISIMDRVSGLCLNSLNTAFDVACPSWLVATGLDTWSYTFNDSIFTHGNNYDLQFMAKDQATNGENPIKTATFLWDAHAPASSAFVINSNVASTMSTSVLLSLTVDTDVVYYRAANGNDCSLASWQAYTPGTIPFTLNSPEGIKTVCMEVKDDIDNVTTTSTDAINLDLTLPDSSVSVAATLGPQSMVGGQTTLSGSASDDNTGIDKMYVSVQEGAGLCLSALGTAFDALCPHWILATGTTSWSLSVADGVLNHGTTYNISSKAQDVAGNNETSFGTGSFIWDSVPPIATFVINSNDTYTNTQNVNLTLSDVSGIAMYRKANGGDCSGATWVNYTVNPLSHTLAAVDGTKTVCLQVKDAVGNVSTLATDIIIMDLTLPTSTVSTSGTLGPETTVGVNTTLSGTATDVTSGISNVEISIQQGAGNCLNGSLTAFDAVCPVWLAVAGTTGWTFDVADSLLVDAQTYNIQTKAVDVATNTQTVMGSGSFIWDSSPPVFISLNLVNDAADSYINSTERANSTAIAGSLTTGGHTTAAYQLVSTALACDASLSYGAIPASNSSDFGADGTYKVCVELIDAVGNKSYASTSNITLDILAPTATLSGEPSATNRSGILDVTVGGVGVTHYQYKVGVSASTDCSSAIGYSTEAAIGTHISDNIVGLSDGAITLCVVGRDVAGNYQAYASATSATWNKDRTPPSAVSTLNKINDDSQVSLSWVDGGGDTYQYLVVRRASAAITWVPSDGSSYSAGAIDADHTIAYVGASLSPVDSGLTNYTTYNYAVYAFDSLYNYSSVSSISGKPLLSPLKGIQSGTATLAAGTTSISATITAVDLTKSILTFGTSATSAANGPRYGSIMGVMTNATTLTFTRVTASGSPAITLKWYVTEFRSGVTVQRGTKSISGGTSFNQAISAVNLSNSFPIISFKTSGTSYGSDDYFKANLTSTTNLNFSNQLSAASATAAWQVIEFSGANVQSGSFSIGSGLSSATAAIPQAIDTSKTMLVMSYDTTSSTASMAEHMVRGQINSSTQLTFNRISTNAITASGYWYVIEFNNGSTVQKGSQSVAAGTASSNITVNALTVAQSLPFSGGIWGLGSDSTYSASDYIGEALFTYSLTSTTNLQVTRGSTTGTSVLNWQVTEFAQ